MQDEDLDTHVFDEVVQQLERIAENAPVEELFDRIDGHAWQDGSLMFRIRWKTDEVSSYFAVLNREKRFSK